MQSSLVTDFAMVLGVAMVTGVIARRLQQPPILGYLCAGLIVGPYIPIPLFADAERIHELSELGIVLVMFAVGLEFSLGRAAKVLPLAGLAATVQIAGMFWAGNMLAGVLGLSAAGGVVLGASLAVSSTMVVTKVFDVHPPPDDVRGVVLGILVLQDLVAIVLITVVTAVAQGSEAEPGALAGVVGTLVGVIVACVLAGLAFVPRMTRWVRKLESPEVDVVFAIGLCFVFAAVMQELGYSAALGAFLAGMLVAESGLGEHFEHLVAPLRDAFAAVFFVSVGMTFDPRMALVHLPEAAAIAATVIILQGLFVTGAGLLSGLGLRRAGHAGLALGQLGEFAFIIIGIGVSAGVVEPYMFTVVVLASVVTTFTTTMGLGAAERLISAIERMLPRRVATYLSLYSAWIDGVRNGERVSEQARAMRRALTFLVLDAAIVGAIVIAASLSTEFLTQWLNAALGLGSLPALALLVLGAGVLAFPFARGMWRSAAALGLSLARAAFPAQPSHLEAQKPPDLASTSRKTMSRGLRLGALLGAGVLVVGITSPFVPFGSGALLLGAALLPSTLGLWRSGEPLGEHVRSATLALFELLRNGDLEPRSPQTRELLHGLGDVTAVRLEEGALGVGKTLAQFDLRAKTGTSVLAIIHTDAQVSTPTGSEVLQAGDVLAVAGPRAAVAMARASLEGQGPEAGSSSDSAV